MGLYEELQEMDQRLKMLRPYEKDMPRVNLANGLTVKITELVKELDSLHNGPILHRREGYYAVSLEKKYGKPICELAKIAVEWKRKQRVKEREIKVNHILKHVETIDGFVSLENVKKLLGELIR